MTREQAHPSPVMADVLDSMRALRSATRQELQEHTGRASDSVKRALQRLRLAGWLVATRSNGPVPLTYTYLGFRMARIPIVSQYGEQLPAWWPGKGVPHV